jgi:small multidrug resistance pump
MFGWIYMILAILFEVAGTTSMKFSEGFTKVWPSIFIFLFYALCFSVLTLALKTIEVSTAYAIWSGLGTVLIVTIGILWFNESVSLVKILSIVLIIIGVVGLQLNNEIIADEGKGILSSDDASLNDFETTNPIKTQDILPPSSESALIMPEMSVENPEMKKLPINPVELSTKQTEDQTN